MRVLNVGGGASRHLPESYNGWEQVLLDIDPATGADIVCDAKELISRPETDFDAVYCSHNLEHFYRHDVPVVLAGFLHCLREGGRVEIHVPNIKNLMQTMLASNLDVMDVWYRTGDGSPVTFHDVLYGWNVAMSNGNEFYSHKCGFTVMSLGTALHAAGFRDVQVFDQGSNLMAVGVK